MKMLVACLFALAAFWTIVHAASWEESIRAINTLLAARQLPAAGARLLAAMQSDAGRYYGRIFKVDRTHRQYDRVVSLGVT